MNGNPRFWTLMILFQVAFGLAVFAATRQYYVAGPGRPVDVRKAPAQLAWPQTSPSQAMPSQVAPVWPPLTADGNLDQLASAFPADAANVDPAVLVAHADQLYDNGQYPEAVKLYRQALAAGAKDAATYNNLAITLQNLGRSDEALEALNEGIALDPSYQRIWLTLGFVSGQVGQDEQARSALQKAVEMGPDNDVGRAAAGMLESLP
jgi:tetratricopeptide (TPR) repeat protein